LVPSLKSILKTTNWGIPATGIVWWLAALVPPGPAHNQWFALLFLPWFLWNISYYKFVRFVCWPSLIGTILLFKSELSNLSLITHIILSLSYYFFLLEESEIPESESSPLTMQDISFAPVEMFIISSFAVISLSWYMFLPFNSIYVLLYASIGAANIGVWKLWVSIDRSKKYNSSGLIFFLSLLFVGFLAHKLNLPSIFFGSMSALVVFTLLSPKIKPKNIS
jgi:hypothetical protein